MHGQNVGASQVRWGATRQARGALLFSGSARTWGSCSHLSTHLYQTQPFAIKEPGDIQVIHLQVDVLQKHHVANVLSGRTRCDQGRS
jgi:hypothetical protein